MAGLRKAGNSTTHPASPVGRSALAEAAVEHIDAVEEPLPAPAEGPQETATPSGPAQERHDAAAKADVAEQVAGEGVGGENNVVRMSPRTPARTSAHPSGRTSGRTRSGATARDRGAQPDLGGASTTAGEVFSPSQTVQPQTSPPAGPEDEPAGQPERAEQVAPQAPDRSSAAKAEVATGQVPPRPQPGVRRVEVSKRGKRDFNYSWPKVDVAVMRATWEQYRPKYRRYWAEQDPNGSYRLVFSAFVAHALQVAFEDVDPWLSTIRNDARREPVDGGREQVGLVWPVAVENKIVDLWETLDKSRFPEGFHLTKQHLASAAILHGLSSVEDWYTEVGNDDRFSIPVDTDGRLRENRSLRSASPDQVEATSVAGDARCADASAQEGTDAVPGPDAAWERPDSERPDRPDA